MTSACQNSVARYELPLGEQQAASPGGSCAIAASLSAPLLARSAAWFCRIRWGVAAALAGLGVLGRSESLTRSLRLLPARSWPMVCAGVLLAANVLLAGWARRASESAQPGRIQLNLWAQIIVDLLVLTAVVHFVGTTSTFVAFSYLFHIVLACIFFPRKSSLAVALLACGLLVACVLAEQTGLLQPQTIFAGVRPVARGLVAFDVASALLVWAAVWYLASHLSTMVRQRDVALADANRLLLAAQEERTWHLLMTTHQLKAPFAAIHANTQLLLGGVCGPLSEQALPVVQRIAARCRRLAREIQDMLVLADLAASGMSQAPKTNVRLDRLTLQCLKELEPTCRDREVQVDLKADEVSVPGAEDQFRVLLANVLSNAMAYSHRGGRITVECGPDGAGSARVTVTDRGIGIDARKLPRIFDDYYRTDEAVQHNPESSGLGLAIVRHIAQMNAIQIRVQSQAGAGTVFDLVFPGLAGSCEPSI